MCEKNDVKLGNVIDYVLVDEFDVRHFNKRINRYLDDGYKLHGSPCIGTHHGQEIFIQAVVKFEQKK